MASIEGINQELASTVLDAVRCLPISKQAAILLDTSLSLIEAGQCALFRGYCSQPSAYLCLQIWEPS